MRGFVGGDRVGEGEVRGDAAGRDEEEVGVGEGLVRGGRFACWVGGVVEDCGCWCCGGCG